MPSVLCWRTAACRRRGLAVHYWAAAGTAWVTTSRNSGGFRHRVGTQRRDQLRRWRGDSEAMWRAALSSPYRGWRAQQSRESRACRDAVAETMRDYIRTVYQKAADVEGFQASADGWTLSAKDAAYLTQLSKGMTISFLCRSPGCMFFGMNDQWIEHAANIPKSKATIAGWTLSSSEAGYLTEISRGVLIAFMCRQTTCGLFGMNDDWIKTVDSKHLRCPQCGHTYRPSSRVNGACSAQKVLHIVEPVSGVMMVIPCKSPG